MLPNWAYNRKVDKDKQREGVSKMTFTSLDVRSYWNDLTDADKVWIDSEMLAELVASSEFDEAMEYLEVCMKARNEARLKTLLVRMDYMYENVLASMKESLSMHDMTFRQAWNYELQYSKKAYTLPVRDILKREGKTFMNLFWDLEDTGYITGANYYHEPFDLAIQRELGNE
jgi:hypothetical protein